EKIQQRITDNLNEIIMKTASLTEALIYTEDKPSITLLLKTDTTKELRIALKEGQLMKEHKAPYPIIVEIF
ncbi:hypothetical protein V6246_18190, partial [Algibacter sp. TI.3.09]